MAMGTSGLCTLRIDGMPCDHCVATVTDALRQVAGVNQALVTLKPGKAIVHGESLDARQLADAVDGAGFSASLVSNQSSEIRTDQQTMDCCPQAGGEDEGYQPTPGSAGTEGEYAKIDPHRLIRGGENSDFDLIVVGGGSAGFAAAIRAHDLGANVALINAGTIGGTCVNVGCVPSKTLIRAAEAHHRAGHHRFDGIDGSSRVADFSAIIRQKRELVESLRQAKYVDVLTAHERVHLVNGQGVLESSNMVRVGNQVLRAPRVIITTGSRPWTPPIPGLAEVNPLTSTSAFELERLPTTLNIIGGRYIALECAQMLSRLGSRVTILQRSGSILPTEDDDLSKDLADYFREEGIQVEVGTNVKAVTQDRNGVTVHAQIGNEEQSFKAERILCATGRIPITDGFGLTEVGVSLGRNRRIDVNEHLQTSVPGIYAAGDVIGEPAFVYTAAYEGNLAAENALNGNQKIRDYTALPWVISTDPQVSGVGFNEKEAAAGGLKLDISRLDMGYIPRALAARDTRGFIKLLKERDSDRLVGVRILAPEGGEQIMEAALAIRHGIGVSELASAFHPYLTQSEGIKLCAQGFEKDVRELSCCSA